MKRGVHASCNQQWASVVSSEKVTWSCVNMTIARILVKKKKQKAPGRSATTQDSSVRNISVAVTCSNESVILLVGPKRQAALHIPRSLVGMQWLCLQARQNCRIMEPLQDQK